MNRAPTKYNKAVMHIDACAQPNPGPAGAGVIMKDAEGEVIFTLSEPLGTQTNNAAEYLSLIHGLERVVSEYDVGTLVVRSDSQLLVNQVNGTYKVKKPELIALKGQVDMLVEQLTGFRIEHIPREQNEEADRLSDEAVRGKGTKRPAGRYVTATDVQRYCSEHCEVGAFGDGRCAERSCHLNGFAGASLI